MLESIFAKESFQIRARTWAPKQPHDRPARPTTPKRASENERGQKKGVQGQRPRRSFLRLSPEKAGLPPGVGRKPTSQGPPCAGPNQDHLPIRQAPTPLELERRIPHEPPSPPPFGKQHPSLRQGGHLTLALRAMEAAHARGASLLVSPEMFLTGYLIRDRLEELAEPVPDGPSLLVPPGKGPRPLPGPGGGPACGPPPAASPYNALVMIDRDGSVAGVQGKPTSSVGRRRCSTSAPPSGPLTPPSAGWAFWCATTGSSQRPPAPWPWTGPSSSAWGRPT